MLTVKQVSQRLGISLALVYREIRAGRLPAHCFGKRAYRVSEEQIATYLAMSQADRQSQSAPVRRGFGHLKHISL